MSALRHNQAEEPLHQGDRLLDRYSIVERIASGGHSIVYQGEDERLLRPVCVKVFHRFNSGDGAYRTTYEHFVQEAFALSKLTHPNTLRIYDFGYLDKQDERDPGAPFQVSEFMTDGTLWRQVKQRGPLPHEEARAIITALGGALGDAHHSDIIHRDIKPHNILFTAAGRKLVVKLADFGIAKALAESTSVLHHRADDTSVVVGRPFLMYSPYWASPEQLAGMPLGRASDIYALALSFVYLLTGNVVFRSNDALESYEQRHASDAFVDAACAGHDLPAGVLELLKRACVFDPEQRPGEAEELAHELAERLRSRDPAPRAQPRLRSVPGTAPPAEEAARSAAPPRRLHVSAEPLWLGNRRVCFVPAPGGDVILSCCQDAARLRLAFVPSENRFCVHLRGMSCFVARDQGRPSSAVQFEQDGRCDLLAPNRHLIATVAVSPGKSAAGHRIFDLGGETIALSTEECPQAATLDFGPGGDYLIIYTPGMPMDSANGHGALSRRVQRP